MTSLADAQPTKRKPLSENGLVFIMYYFLRLSESGNEGLELGDKLSDDKGSFGLSSAELWKQDVRQATFLAGYRGQKWPPTDKWLRMTPRRLAQHLLKQVMT